MVTAAVAAVVAAVSQTNKRSFRGPGITYEFENVAGAGGHSSRMCPVCVAGVTPN